MAGSEAKVLICPKCFNILAENLPQCPHCAERRPAIGWDREQYLGLMLMDRWEVVQRLGAGATGAVYLAHDRRADEGEDPRVAVKFLHRRLSNDENLRLRFRREALAASQISSPYIAQTYAFGELEDTTLFLVMEFIAGVSLRAFLDPKEMLPSTAIVDIALQIAEGLEAAADKGVVHRDLKPANIFLVPRSDGTHAVKILDFGYALIKARERGAVKLTKTGIIVGTPTYMSPEQTEGRRDIDGRSDVYALGVILFRMLSGVFPFDAETVMELVLKHRTQKPKRLRNHLGERRDVPAALEAIVMKLMARRRERRFASAHEVREALWPFSTEGRGGTSQPVLATATGKEPPSELSLSLPIAPEGASQSIGRGRQYFVIGGVALAVVTLLILLFVFDVL